MRFRDRPHALAQQIWVLQNVSAELTSNLASAFLTTARDPAAEALRTRWPAGSGRARVTLSEIEALVARSVVQVDAELSELALIATARSHGYSGLPIAITIASNSVAVNIAHGVFDGGGALEMLRHIVSLAVGAPHTLDSSPLAKRPLWTALRSVPKGSFQRLVAQRRERNEARAEARPPTSADIALEHASYVSFVVKPTVMKAIASAKDTSPNPVRLTRNNRLCSLVVESLKAVYRGEVDQAVELPIDLRRFAGAGRVEGNFISADLLGTLLTSDWGPSEISRRTAALLASGTPVLSMAASMLGPIRAAVEGTVRRSAGGGHYSVAVSMLNEKMDFPAEIWNAGEDPLMGCATVAPWPSSTLAVVATSGARVRISFWDDSGLFDLSKIEESFHSEVDRRATAIA